MFISPNAISPFMITIMWICYKISRHIQSFNVIAGPDKRA